MMTARFTFLTVATLALGWCVSCSDNNLSFQKSDWDRSDIGRKLPAGFLLGAATSSHQIEGGNQNSWTRWEAGSFPDGRPHIHNNEQSGNASGSWNQFVALDVPLLEQLGANAYRLSVEWSRIEPQPGAYDFAAEQTYLNLVTTLRQRGIEPMVTLHHFTLPFWFEDLGGFEKRENLSHFVRFAERVGALLGSQVDLWCTINEPNVYATQGYLDGIWPPGLKDSTLAAEVLANLIEAHALATTALRASDSVDANGDGAAVLSGLAHHVRVFQPATASTLDVSVTGLTDEFFNESIVQAASTGRIRISVPGEVSIDRPVEGLAGSFDYLGINYYTRDFVRADLGSESLSNMYVPDARPKNDLGWDVYPEGLYLFLKRFSAFGWPMYITENGVSDNQGSQRFDSVRMHLHAVERAAAEGIDVRGYFHWSLIDNFEWAEGFEPRFGLFTIDYASSALPRCPTSGVKAFREVARNLGRAPLGTEQCQKPLD